VTVAGAPAVKSVPATSHVTKSVRVLGSVAHPLTNADKVNVKGVGVRRSAKPESVYKADLAPDQLCVGGRVTAALMPVTLQAECTNGTKGSRASHMELGSFIVSRALSVLEGVFLVSTAYGMCERRLKLEEKKKAGGGVGGRRSSRRTPRPAAAYYTCLICWIEL